MGDVLTSPEYRAMREDLKATWQRADAPCWICGQEVDYDGDPHLPDSFDLDHVKSRKKHPELALDPRNCKPSHVRCNRSRKNKDPRPPIGETSEDW